MVEIYYLDHKFDVRKTDLLWSHFFYVLRPINVCHKSMENNFVILFFVFLEALHSLHVRNNYFDHDFHFVQGLNSFY